MFVPTKFMKIYKPNIFRLTRNSFFQRSVRIVLVYSFFFLTTSEVFADNSIATKNCIKEYFITVNQNTIESNLNERSQRYKTHDSSKFNYDKSALVSDQFNSEYTEYFVNDTFYSVIFLLKICNSNHSFRAPPIN
jgi:thermostable 8-oxoguanine DNA glycosylase